MRNRVFGVVLVFCFGSVLPSWANVFSNPSFEDGAGAVTFLVSGEFGGADALELTSGGSEIPDWTWEQTEGESGGAAWLEDTGDLFGSDGEHLVYLDVNQCIQWNDLATELAAGGSYRFEYNFATWERGQDSGGPASGTGSVLLEYNYLDGDAARQYGQWVVDIRPPENMNASPGDLQWLSGSETLVIPTDYSSDLNFLITTNGGGLLVDNVAFAPVPEPRVGALLCGFALALVVRRRRRRC